MDPVPTVPTSSTSASPAILLPPDSSPDPPPHIGMDFDTAEQARAFYCAYAGRVGFRVRNSKSFTSRVDDSVIMRRFVCSRQGRPSKKDPFDLTKKRRNRASSREGCHAMLQVNRRENGRWTISRFVQDHCHPFISSPSNSSPSSKNPKPLLLPGPTQALIPNPNSRHAQTGLGPGGGVAQSLLEYFKKMQAQNPNFFYAVQLDGNNCVGNLFWADSRARVVGLNFADSVRFDLSCKRSKKAVPFAALTGLNHHRELVIFGCAFMTDETEESFTWLFDTWRTLIGPHKPASITTCFDESIESAISRVFPNSRHRFCKKDIFNKCKENLSNLYTSDPGFKPELKRVVNGSETPDEFESGWKNLLERYNLNEDLWLGFLFTIRHKWVPAFLTNSFFGEILKNEKFETMQKFFQKNSITTTTLRDLVSQFDKAMWIQYEREIQMDRVTGQTRPIMRTGFPMEKQASEFYTKIIFDAFQEELVEASCLFPEKFEESGPICKFHVFKFENRSDFHTVIYNSSDKILSCDCLKFEFCGIQCRHVFKVLVASGELLLPELYLLKRWGRNAKSEGLFCNYSDLWVEDLCRDATRLAEEGSTCQSVYKAARSALSKAIMEVLKAKGLCSSVGSRVL
ncbi:hypothetical protein LUZ60_007640 [Juncus effusus]|nr:hypothetical protein LUZ60_007640 [Juncus effusus]